MADFVAISVDRVDPVSGKTIVGDGTGKRVEYHKRVAGVDTAIASLTDAGYQTLASGLTISTFTAGTVVSNASGVLSVSASGGTVTLAGDVTGPSSANVVEKLTGLGLTNNVTVLASTLSWAAINSDWGLQQTSPTSNSPAGNFTLQLAAPFASAIGANRNAPNAYFLMPANVSGGVAGEWTFRHASTDSFVIASDHVRFQEVHATTTLTLKAAGVSSLVASATSLSVGVGIIQFASTLTTAFISQASQSGAGRPFAITAQASTANVGGSMSVGSGAGGAGNPDGELDLYVGSSHAVSFLPGTVPISHFYTNSIRWDKGCTTPTFYQDQQTADVVPAPMVIRTQAPDTGATIGGSPDRRVAGNLRIEIPSSVNGADQIGHLEVQVADRISFRAWYTHVEIGGDTIEFAGDFGSGAVVQVADPATGAIGGIPLALYGQRAGTGGSGVNPGGNVMVQGGPGAGGAQGGGFIAQVGSAAQPSLQTVQIGSKYINALGFPSVLGASDVPADNSNVLYVADCYNLDNILTDGIGKTNGITIASAFGYVLLQNSQGVGAQYVMFTGNVLPTAGSHYGYCTLNVNGVDVKVELLNT